MDGADEHEPVARPRQGDVEALLEMRGGLRLLHEGVRHHRQEHDIALVALQGRAVAADEAVPQHHLFAELVDEHPVDERGLRRRR